MASFAFDKLPHILNRLLQLFMAVFCILRIFWMVNLMPYIFSKDFLFLNYLTVLLSIVIN